jgi:hypothetical protein
MIRRQATGRPPGEAVAGAAFTSVDGSLPRSGTARQRIIGLSSWTLHDMHDAIAALLNLLSKCPLLHQSARLSCVFLACIPTNTWLPPPLRSCAAGFSWHRVTKGNGIQSSLRRLKHSGLKPASKADNAWLHTLSGHKKLTSNQARDWGLRSLQPCSLARGAFICVLSAPPCAET